MATQPFSPKDTTGNHRFTEKGYQGIKAPKRNLILWQVPHLGNNRFIEMYVNPQGITFSNKKTITSKRTKGGFLNQYWGEELETVSVNGSTGDGGIEAINVLLDVYRSEQLTFLQLAETAFANDSNSAKRRQPLGPLANSIIMWYMGQGKRGYFTDFQYDENVSMNGSFQYRISYVVLETIGTRKNFMPWHRKPWSTTETPNVAAGGSVVVTGGYPGDQSTRVGRLNSPVGKVELEIVEEKQEDGTVLTAAREVWRQSPMFDPKYWQEDFVNPSLFPTQTTGTENISSNEADTAGLSESARTAADIGSVAGTVNTDVPDGESELDGKSDNEVPLEVARASLAQQTTSVSDQQASIDAEQQRLATEKQKVEHRLKSQVLSSEGQKENEKRLQEIEKELGELDEREKELVRQQAVESQSVSSNGEKTQTEEASVE